MVRHRNGYNGGNSLPPHGGSGLKWAALGDSSVFHGLPPHGGSGLKYRLFKAIVLCGLSPSTRREWIEIHHRNITRSCIAWSPSTRREWIEMLLRTTCGMCQKSPSTRREWIEMPVASPTAQKCWSLPPHGGSGLKYIRDYRDRSQKGLPPHGGSGLKYRRLRHSRQQIVSPSTRREWIEMGWHKPRLRR